MCVSNGSKLWTPSALINDKFGAVGRAVQPFGLDKAEKEVFRNFQQQTILGAASPTTPDAAFASPNDPTRRRVGNASGELSTMLGA